MTRNFGEFRVVRKHPGEWCYDSLPWKATNNVVCVDSKTILQTCRSAYRLNLEDRTGRFTKRTDGERP